LIEEKGGGKAKKGEAVLFTRKVRKRIGSSIGIVEGKRKERIALQRGGGMLNNLNEKPVPKSQDFRQTAQTTKVLLGLKEITIEP